MAQHNTFYPGLPFLLFVGFCLGTVGSAAAQQPRILNGQLTDDYPSVGIVGSAQNGGFCTGTLISSTHVLTAAHCAEVIESPAAGTFQLGDQVYQTQDVIIHPDYNPLTLSADIAILELDQPVLDVQPSAIFRDAPLVGDILFIVGFGGSGTADGGSDGTFGTKREGVTTIDEVTPELVSWTFDDSSESNTAAGDSGGPGFLDIEGDLFIASVTSGGTEPDSVLGDFAFNTRVDAFADWIDLVLATSGQPGGTPDDPGDTPGDDSPGDDPLACDEFWAQPFPVLQLLINFLTALLDALNEAIEQPDDGGAQPPGDNPDETPDDGPPADEPPADEPPADGPPADAPPADEPVDQPPVDVPPIDVPPIDVPPIDIPTEPPVGFPPGGGVDLPGGIPPGIETLDRRGNRVIPRPTRGRRPNRR